MSRINYRYFLYFLLSLSLPVLVIVGFNYGFKGNSTMTQSITWNVSGPSTLVVNKLGTWLVQVKLPSGQFASSSDLAVLWGDQEGQPPAWQNLVLTETPPQGSPFSFFHAFKNPGKYTITFRASVAEKKYSEKKLIVTVTKAQQ